jgi:hypothetical protein
MKLQFWLLARVENAFADGLQMLLDGHLGQSPIPFPTGLENAVMASTCSAPMFFGANIAMAVGKGEIVDAGNERQQTRPPGPIIQ